MSPTEIAEFRASPDWPLALELREIDDRAKLPGAEVPGLESYADELSAAVAQESQCG